VSEIRFLHEFYNNHTRKVIEFCRLNPTHRLVLVNLSAAITYAGEDDETAPGRVLENTFGISADRCWQDPQDDLYVNHIHDIVKHAVETKDEAAVIPVPPLQLPLPVIVVGFPKSGTTSVWSFFRCAGIVAQHYCCCGDVSDRPPCYTHTFAECMLDNISHNRSSMQDCGDYPVYAQLDGERSYFDKVLRKQPQLFLSHFLPQHFQLDEIHAFAPAATYVLPLRDPMAWAESVNHWFNMQVRVSNEYRWYNVSMVTDLLPRDQKKDIARLPEEQALELLAKLYQDHTDKVRSFVRQHPSHALVEFNITQHDAGQILANAFGLPSSCWVRKENNSLLDCDSCFSSLSHNTVSSPNTLFFGLHFNMTGTQEQKREDETKHYNDDDNVTRVQFLMLQTTRLLRVASGPGPTLYVTTS
jgi:Sulfotransferase domain